MEISLALRLPRERLSVPVARHVVRDAMRAVGVEATCIADVELALSEACTNVLQHAGPADEYDVRLDLADERCAVRVIDVGQGFDALRRPGAAPEPDAERGRGLNLINALVDRAQFSSRPEAGTVVRLEKQLTYDNPALLGDGPDDRDAR
jgi:serine/threonine-protein kinase RsbW